MTIPTKDDDEPKNIEAKYVERNALTKTPTEWLEIAEEELAKGWAHFNAAMVQQCSPAELAAGHDLLKLVDKGVKKFHENVRGRLALVVEQHGTIVTDNGAMELDLGNGRRQRITPDSTKYEDKEIEKLLRSKGLSLDIHMDKDIKYKQNPRKLKELLDTEQITQKELNACLPVRAWRVGKSMKAEDKEDE